MTRRRALFDVAHWRIASGVYRLASAPPTRARVERHVVCDAQFVVVVDRVLRRGPWARRGRELDARCKGAMRVMIYTYWERYMRAPRGTSLASAHLTREMQSASHHHQSTKARRGPASAAWRACRSVWFPPGPANCALTPPPELRGSPGGASHDGLVVVAF